MSSTVEVVPSLPAGGMTSFSGAGAPAWAGAGWLEGCEAGQRQVPGVSAPCDVVLGYRRARDHYGCGVLDLHFSQQHVAVLGELDVCTRPYRA